MPRLAAGVTRREDGLLEKRFTIDNKEYAVSGATHRELITKEMELREQLRRDVQGARSELTLDQYFRIWLPRKEREDKEVTAYRYNRQFQTNISPYLGFRRLQEITQSDAFSLQQQLATQLKPKTVNYMLRLLRSILDDAVTEELIPVNPAAGIRALRQTQPPATDGPHRALTEEEQITFMRAARKNFFYEFFAFLLLTGMRYGEAAALTWADIDREQEMIHISRGLTFTKEGQVTVGTTKTRAGTRDIPLTSQIRRILDLQLQKLVSQVGLPSADARAPGQRIFCSPGGGVVHNRTANLNLQSILQDLEAAGTPIPHFTLHAFRDTFATRFIEQGGNPQTLKVLLGHSHLSVTMDTYSQVMPDTKKIEMARLEIALG